MFAGATQTIDSRRKKPEIEKAREMNPIKDGKYGKEFIIQPDNNTIVDPWNPYSKETANYMDYQFADSTDETATFGTVEMSQEM